jgi:hypothetical protein
MSGKHVRTEQHQACVLPSDTKSAIDVHRCDGMDRQRRLPASPHVL